MTKVKRFEDLESWKTARILVKEIFILSKKGELNKDFDFKSQIRRCALSVIPFLKELLIISQANE